MDFGPARNRIASLAMVPALCMVTALATPTVAHPHIWVTVETTVLYDQGTVVGLRHKWSFDEFYAAMAIQGLDANNDGIYDRQELAELAKVNIEGLKEFGYFTPAKLAGQDLAFGPPRDYWLEYAPSADAGTAAPASATASPSPATTAPGSTTTAADGSGLFARLWAWLFGSDGSSATEAKAAAPVKHVLSLHVTLPFAQPVLADAPGLSFAVYDPSYFIAFELASTEPVKIGPGAPAGCRAVLGGTAEPEADDTKRLGQAFAAELPGKGFSLGTSKSVSVSCEPKS